jgi:hypothetical protein
LPEVNDRHDGAEKNACAAIECSSRAHGALERERLKLPGEAQMTSWVRFESAEGAGFGVLDGASIRVHEGDLFDRPTATDRSVQREPSADDAGAAGQGARGLEQLPRADREDELARAGGAALFHQVAERYLDPGATIRKPACDSRIIFEASSRS